MASISITSCCNILKKAIVATSITPTPSYSRLINHTTRTTSKRQFSQWERIPDNTKIQILGASNKEEHGNLKQYTLVQIPSHEIPDPKPLACLYAKGNVIFGTKLLDKEFSYETACGPLLHLALSEASTTGEQPQGLAALGGLCDYVRSNLEEQEQKGQSTVSSSAAMKILKEDGSNEGKIVYEAIKSIATQIPREGHETIGFGTYKDARPGWTELAKEYATLPPPSSISSSSTSTNDIGSNEAKLFTRRGGVLVKIEYGVDDEKYLADAGGAMARFFFL